MKLLLTGAFNYTEKQLVELQDLGYDITFIQDEREEVSFDVSEFEVVVCNNLFLYNDISKFNKLKAVQLTSAGVDRVPLNYIKENNIQLYNAKDVYSIPMAEWVILKILEIYKKSTFFYENQLYSKWKKHRSLFELTDKNVGIIGYGSTGYEISKRLKSFGTKNFAINRTEISNEYIDRYVPLTQLEQILPELDIIVLSIALTDNTKYLISKKEIDLMKNQSVLVNIARGGLVKESDLVDAIKNGKFMGIALDVFEEEPLIDSPLWGFKNAIITPHNSYISDKVNIRLFNDIYKNLAKI